MHFQVELLNRRRRGSLETKYFSELFKLQIKASKAKEHMDWMCLEDYKKHKEVANSMVRKVHVHEEIDPRS